MAFVLAFYLTYILTIYLAYIIPTFYLALYLTLYLASFLAFFLAHSGQFGSMLAQLHPELAIGFGPVLAGQLELSMSFWHVLSSGSIGARGRRRSCTFLKI